ncbi:MAG TPA: hypothetical protein VFA26_14685 [Gemmataceae bacterium]|nr:hypothetical protein [Gemmataceae bacterium]
MRRKLALCGGLAMAALLPLLPAGCCCTGVGKVREAAERQKTQNDLKQIALAYINYCDANPNKGPAKADDLRQYLGGNAELLQAMTSGKYTVIWNVTIADVARNQGGTSGTVLAYESTAPTTGGAVAMADGSVRQMTAPEFNAAKKAQPKKQ